jgi:tetratricopeptide (TPR) repeat protein
VSKSRKRKRPGASPQKLAEPSGANPSTRASQNSWAGLLLIAACFVAGIGGGFYLRSRSTFSETPPVVPAAEQTEKETVDTEGSKSVDVDSPTSRSADPTAAEASSSVTTSPVSTLPVQPPADLATRQAAERRFGTLFRRGYENFHRERYAEAAEDFQQAVHVAPYLGEGHFYLGEVYRKMAFATKAEQCYHEALIRLPDFPDADRQLCILLYERGAYEEALERLEQRRRRDPNDAFTLGEMAVNLLALGKPQDAVPLLEQFNALSGQQAWGYAHLGRAYDLMNEHARAEQLYREAIAMNAYLDIGHYWLGLLLSREGNEQEGQKSLARYQELRTLQNSEHTLQMALLRNASDIDTLIRLGQTRYALGKRKEAIATLQRAEKLAPNHPEVLRTFRQWNSD